MVRNWRWGLATARMWQGRLVTQVTGQFDTAITLPRSRSQPVPTGQDPEAPFNDGVIESQS